MEEATTLDRLPVGRAPMILVASLIGSQKELLLTEQIKKYCKYFKVKSRTVSSGRCNLVIEVRALKEYEMMQELEKLEGVESLSLVSHDGEVTF